MHTRSRRLAALAVPLVAASAAILPGGAPAEAAPSVPAVVVPGATNGLIAFSDDRDGNREIYTIHADGTGLQRLTNDAADDIDPRWSPDGSQIAFLRGFHLWVMDADGSDAHQVVDYASDYQLSWSPDASQIAYIRDGELWVTNADGTGPHRVLAVAASGGYDLESPDWTPDGTEIAYLRSVGPGQATIHAVAPDGSGDHQISAGFGHTPRWSPDGDTLAYAESGLTVEGITPPSDADRIVFLNASEGILRGLSWAPDQTRLVYAQNAYVGGTWTHPSISTVAVDGSDVQPLTTGWTPDWQPVPPVLPDTTVTGTTNDGWRLDQPQLELGSDHAASWFQCSLDGAAWAECASPYVPAWRPGDHRLEVRAVYEGNADPSPAAVTWTTPYDDRQLTRRGKWTRVRGAEANYRGSVLSGAARGASLSLAKVRATELALIASTCKGCGAVDVFYGKQMLQHVSLASRQTQTKVVIPLGSWETPHRGGTVRIVVATNGKPVQIDGLGVSRRPAVG